MRICSLPFNLTATTSLALTLTNSFCFVVTSFVKLSQAGQFGSFDFKRKRFTGYFANVFLNGFFLKKKNEKQEELFRYCNFIQADEDGRILENGSITGSLGNVITGRADFDFMFRNLRARTNLIHVSNVVNNADLVAGHYVNEVRKHSAWINFESFSIFAPSFWFFLEYVSMFILAFLFAYLLGRYLKSRRPWQFPIRLFYSLFSPEYPTFSRCSAFGALSLSILIFLFFVRQIICNNINTEKVIVDTSQILDSIESIQRTSKEACLPRRGQFLETQAKGTVEYAFNEKMNKQEPCILTDWLMKPFEFAKLKKDFFILNVPNYMSLLKFFNLFYKKDIFISPPFFSRPIGYYLSKRSKRMNRQVRRVFNHYVNIVFENGFAKKSLIEFEQVIDNNYVSLKSTFHTLQEYVDHYTHRIEAVTMDDLSIVYVFYAFWSLTFIVFVVHHLWNFIKRTTLALRFFRYRHLRRRFRRRLRSCFRRLH